MQHWWVLGLCFVINERAWRATKKGKNKTWKKLKKHDKPCSRATSVSFFERGWILVYIFCLVIIIIIISRRNKMKFLNMERAYEPFQLSLTIWAPSIDNTQFPRNSLFKTPKFTGNAWARWCFACKWFCSFFFFHLWPISLWLIARSRNLHSLVYNLKFSSRVLQKL